MKHGIIGAFSVAENTILQDPDDYARASFFNFRAITRHAEDLIHRFNIKTPGANASTKNLSGGNIQKLILARELSRKPAVLIAAQPTRGVDISATEYIHRILMEQRSTGVAILLISEDLDEILALSDRIAVMYEGSIVGIIPRDEADVESLGLMMAGVRETG
jgi:simple sugar transport system ATP-binding protein